MSESLPKREQDTIDHSAKLILDAAILLATVSSPSKIWNKKRQAWLEIFQKWADGDEIQTVSVLDQAIGGTMVLSNECEYCGHFPCGCGG